MTETGFDMHNWIRALQAEHGGLRKAARAVGIDPAYMKRLRDGEKTNPSGKVLDKLGIKREVKYVRRT